MYKHFVLLFILAGTFPAMAQVGRSYLYRGYAVQVLAQNNRMPNSFGFPGMKAFIIVGDSANTPAITYARDALRQMPVSRMHDYACFYYIKYSSWENDTALHHFLQGFIAWCYQTDYIDRNEVYLVWQNESGNIPCSGFNKLADIVSSVAVLSNSYTPQCAAYTVASADTIWKRSHGARTTVKYAVPGITDIEQAEKEKQARAALQSFHQSRGDAFLQVMAGRHHIGNAYRTTFDTTTLVDFSKIKTLWSIKAGYHFTNRLFATLDAAFIYSGKQKHIDHIDWANPNGITVSGSGYAGAMIRYGLGVGLIAYRINRISITTGLDAGSLSTMAGGGKVTRTIGGGGNNNPDVAKHRQRGTYTNIYAALHYRLGKQFFFTTNIQYKIAPLKQPIGSVNAFTGISFNAGLGVIIPTQNKDE